MPTFTYTSLDSSIRLLEVLPDKLNGRIQIRLYKTMLPASHQCLPYMWGEPDEGHEVLVNNQVYSGREDLHTFLEVAAQKLANKSLWIDTLCIDQGSFTERSHQVQRSGEIYREASRVLIWFG
ncbi:hypothetical protein BU25DRAFT_306883, partial [Macroventuria anomochaeta]